MTQIHIRSRIGYWTAFATEADSFLNIRDAAGETRTVLLDADDVETLTCGDHDVAHRRARDLAEFGHHVPVMPTPGIGPGGPAPYDWREPSTRLAALEWRETRLAA